MSDKKSVNVAIDRSYINVLGVIMLLRLIDRYG